MMEPGIEKAPTFGKEESNWPLVAIVILNWNDYEDTAECLESLEGIQYPNYIVVVVDNGSTDDSLHRLQQDFGWCEFITNDENLGFAKGCNIGINYALTHDAEYTLLLNNDTIVKPDFLKPVVETAEKKENCLVGGVIHHYNSPDIWYAGGEISEWKSSGGHINDVKSQSTYETEFITGAMLLLPAEFLYEINGLPTAYFFGHEDLELSCQAQEMGWDLFIDPRSRIEHKVSSSAGQKSAFSYYHNSRNRISFAFRNFTPPAIMKFLLFFTFSRIIRFVQWVASGSSILIYATLLGVYDYITSTDHRKPTYFKNELDG